MNSCSFCRFGLLSLCTRCLGNMRFNLSSFGIIFKIFIGFVLSLLSCVSAGSGCSGGLRRCLLVFSVGFDGVSKD